MWCSACWRNRARTVARNMPFTFSASDRLSEIQPTRRRATLVHFVLRTRGCVKRSHAFQHFHCLLRALSLSCGCSDIFSISLIHAWTTFQFCIFVVRLQRLGYSNFNSSHQSVCTIFVCFAKRWRLFGHFSYLFAPMNKWVCSSVFVRSFPASLAVIMCSICGISPFFDTYACPHAEAMLQRGCHCGSYIAVCALRSLYNDSLVDWFKYVTRAGRPNVQGRTVGGLNILRSVSFPKKWIGE